MPLPLIIVSKLIAIVSKISIGRQDECPGDILWVLRDKDTDSKWSKATGCVKRWVRARRDDMRPNTYNPGIKIKFSSTALDSMRGGTRRINNRVNNAE